MRSGKALVRATVKAIAPTDAINVPYILTFMTHTPITVTEQYFGAR